MYNCILKKSDIEDLNGIEKTHFLNSNARRRNKSLGDLTGISGFGFHIIEIEPGFESTALHRHYHEDECIYVLAGQGQAFIDDKAYEIEAGDFIGHCAGGEAHALKNTGDMTMRCIVVGQRLDHDVADYPRLKKRLFRNKGLPWNLVDFENVHEPEAERKV